jgi:hypothetical protein
MKVSTLKTEVTVPQHIKVFALVLAILDKMYAGERERLLKQAASYYGVTL